MIEIPKDGDNNIETTLNESDVVEMFLPKEIEVGEGVMTDDVTVI